MRSKPTPRVYAVWSMVAQLDSLRELAIQYRRFGGYYPVGYKRHVL